MLVSALIGFFAALLLFYSWHIMRSAHLKLTPVLQWPYTIVYLAIPVGALLMLLRLVPIVRSSSAGWSGGMSARPTGEAVPL